MIPSDKVAEWKVQHGRVFSVVAGGEDYAFRAVSEAEYDVVLKHKHWTSADAEDHLVRLALLWPEDFDIDSVRPGIVTTIAEEITEVSGFDSVYAIKAALDDARHDASGYLHMAKAFILSAMPAYKFEDLYDKTVQELMELVAVSEQILNLQALAMGAEVREPVRLIIKTPEEIEEEMNERLDDGIAKKSDPIAQKLMQKAMMEGMV